MSTVRDFRVATVGDCCIDHYQDQGWFPGGNALNVAVAWNGLGANASYMGPVGDDEAGAWLRAEILRAGLDDSLIETIPGATGLTELSLDEDGEKQILAEHFGVSEAFAPDPSNIAVLGHTDWVHGSLSPNAADLIRDFRVDRRGLSFDFSVRPVTEGLEGLDVAFYSWEGEPGPETDALLESALQGGAKIAVAMCGRHGSRARATGESVSVAGNEIQAVDTCGAGDSFIAHFVIAHLEGSSLEAAMQAGTKAGEEMCRNLGAWLNHRPEKVA